MMTAEEIARALRCGSHTMDICGGCGAHMNSKYCHADICNIAADLIESLQAQLAAAQRREQAAVEDLESLMDRRIPPRYACSFCTKEDRICRVKGHLRECKHRRGPQEVGKGEAE